MKKGLGIAAALVFISIFTSVSYGNITPIYTDFGILMDTGSDTVLWKVQDWTNASYTDSNGKYHEVVRYDLPVGQELVFKNSAQEEIAAIERLTIVVDHDPEVAVDFVCRAGSSATTFSMMSFVDLFSLTNPYGFATASVTATDRSPYTGATIAGAYEGGKVYQARYNSGTLFRNLADGGMSSAGGSYSDSEDYGQTISGVVTRIESSYSFALSAGDAASGTSNFQVTPEPATMSVLLLGGLMAFLRRRKI